MARQHRLGTTAIEYRLSAGGAWGRRNKRQRCSSAPLFSSTNGSPDSRHSAVLIVCWSGARACKRVKQHAPRRPVQYP